MKRPVVLILGGRGVFGRRIAANIAKRPEVEVVVAGRTGSPAIDVRTPVAIETIRSIRPAIVVDTVGPFQTRDYTIARGCAENGIHYVDIADARAYVSAIGELDAIARANDSVILSGACTLPALSTAIIDELSPGAEDVVGIELGISPGHRAPRGAATVGAILSYCGKPIPTIGAGAREFGWGSLASYEYPPPIGKRWLSNVDTPERALWPSRFPSLRNAAIRAGFEIGFLHLALSALSRGVRAHILPALSPCTGFFLRIAAICDRFGTDTGAMHVRVSTRDATRTGLIVAERGDGPQVPAAPPAVIVKKLLALPGYAPLAVRGAHPCVGFATREEITNELRGFAIRYFTDG